jgi:hypothetical protein
VQHLLTLCGTAGKQSNSFLSTMDSMKENDSFFVIEEMKKSVDGNYAKVGNLKEPIDSHRRHNIARVHIVGFSSTGVYTC